MVAFENLSPFLAWELTRWGAYGLFFLLGSYVVASISDLKHLSAQREFMDVWFAFPALVFLLDLHGAHWRLDSVLVAKWGLILAFSALVHRRVGGMLRLATADVAACMATASLLSPVLVAAFFIGLKLLSIPMGALLARGRHVYPFMPVVTVGTFAVLVLGFQQRVIPL